MNYQKKKAEIRQEAIDWQIKVSESNYGYLQLADFSNYFTKLGKRFGLVREFKDNGII